MEELWLHDKELIEKLKNKKGPVRIRIGEECRRFYNIDHIVVQPVEHSYFRQHFGAEIPDGVVPVFILDREGKRKVAFGFVKEQYGPHPEDARRMFPTILAMHSESEKLEKHLRRTKGRVIQIGIPIYPKSFEEELEKILGAAEKAAAHGLELRDLAEGNVSKMEMFDTTLREMEGAPEDAIIRSLITYAKNRGEKVPVQFVDRAMSFNRQKILENIRKERKKIERILKRGKYLGTDEQNNSTV